MDETLRRYIQHVYRYLFFLPSDSEACINHHLAPLGDECQRRTTMGGCFGGLLSSDPERPARPARAAYRSTQPPPLGGRCWSSECTGCHRPATASIRHYTHPLTMKVKLFFPMPWHHVFEVTAKGQVLYQGVSVGYVLMHRLAVKRQPDSQDGKEHQSPDRAGAPPTGPRSGSDASLQLDRRKGHRQRSVSRGPPFVYGTYWTKLISPMMIRAMPAKA
jgi:hypothetical protein